MKDVKEITSKDDETQKSSNHLVDLKDGTKIINNSLRTYKTYKELGDKTYSRTNDSSVPLVYKLEN